MPEVEKGQSSRSGRPGRCPHRRRRRQDICSLPRPPTPLLAFRTVVSKCESVHRPFAGSPLQPSRPSWRRSARELRSGRELQHRGRQSHGEDSVTSWQAGRAQGFALAGVCHAAGNGRASRSQLLYCNLHPHQRHPPTGMPLPARAARRERRQQWRWRPRWRRPGEPLLRLG